MKVKDTHDWFATLQTEFLCQIDSALHDAGRYENLCLFGLLEDFRRMLKLAQRQMIFLRRLFAKKNFYDGSKCANWKIEFPISPDEPHMQKMCQNRTQLVGGKEDTNKSAYWVLTIAQRINCWNTA